MKILRLYFSFSIESTNHYNEELLVLSLLRDLKLKVFSLTRLNARWRYWFKSFQFPFREFMILLPLNHFNLKSHQSCANAMQTFNYIENFLLSNGAFNSGNELFKLFYYNIGLIQSEFKSVKLNRIWCCWNFWFMLNFSCI